MSSGTGVSRRPGRGAAWWQGAQYQGEASEAHLTHQQRRVLRAEPEDENSGRQDQSERQERGLTVEPRNGGCEQRQDENDAAVGAQG